MNDFYLNLKKILLDSKLKYQNSFNIETINLKEFILEKCNKQEKSGIENIE